MVTFVDYYITSFTAFLPALLEVVAVSWAYGVSLFNQCSAWRKKFPADA